MTTSPNTPPELTGQAAAIADKLAAHPFFKRLDTGESADADPAVVPEVEPPVAGGSSDPTAGAATPAAAPAVDPTPPAATASDDDAPSAGEPEADPAATASAPTAAEQQAMLASFRDGDQQVTFSEDDLRRLHGLQQWAHGLDPQVAAAFGAIETGQAVAVPRDQFAQFEAWRATGAPAQAGNVANRTVPEWAADLDPEAAQAFAQMQAELAVARQELAAVQQQAVAARQPDIEAAQLEGQRIFERAQADYAAAHGFTVEQTNDLLDTAVRAGVIPSLVESKREYSPSGVLVRDADLTIVAKQALDFARLQRPDLAPAGQPSAAVTPAPAAAPTAPAATSQTNVASKKARAASLAAAPSAATQPPGFNPATATPQDRRGAIADYLRTEGIAG